MIDLRSDTVTRPDDEMRRAMATAEVGDDVYGEDPTVRLLEEEAAEATGCEAALFVPSGTMGNEICLHLHARPGDEVVLEEQCHILGSEMGAMAALSGLLPRVLRSADGLPAPADVESAIAAGGGYHSRTGLVTLEHTHNYAGGRVFERARVDAVLAVARRHGLPVHLDGARIFNAALALGTTVPELVAGFDSLMFCLSKGLGAPVGSIACGRRDFVLEARRVRKMFGGGMRQVGVLAAAGLVALRRGPSRLADDHDNAALLARGIAGIRGLAIDPATVRTNIVIFTVRPDFFRGALAGSPSAELLTRLRAAGVLGSAVDAERVRLVTHRDVSRAQVEQAVGVLRGVAAA